MRRLLIYGDSLSNGNHGKNAYYDTLAAKGIEYLNRAVGSSGLCLNTPCSMLSQLVKYDDRGFDVVLVWHGSNDWYWGSGKEEFLSSMDKAISIIRERNPDALILWCGPIYRYEAPDSFSEKSIAWDTKNKVGLTLRDYEKMVKASAKSLSIHYLDMDGSVQIHQGHAAIFLEDNVQPNEQGYERISRALVLELEKLFFLKNGERL